MTRDEFINKYWNYYLMLEDKFINSIRYIELSPDNYNSYSIEFVSQLSVIGSEIDTIMKTISGFAANERKHIDAYAPRVMQQFPALINQEVKVESRGIKLKPFENWNTQQPSQSLFWWEDYNSVKHGRVDNIKRANLKAVLYALAGLFALESFWLKEIAKPSDDIDIPDKQSQLFNLINWQYRHVSATGLVFKSNDGGKTINIGGGGA